MFSGGELCEYYRETWFTQEGARLKYLKLRARGIPDLTDWRFITLTIARRDITPVQAFALGKERLRVFTRWWRDVLGEKVLWCWKLELHEDGYPHWHMLVEYRNRIPQDFFESVQDAWGLGRINVERVKGHEMHYVFKYVTKGMTEVPSWILDFKKRIRCFQAASGFFSEKPRVFDLGHEKTKSMVPVTIRTQMKWDERRALLKFKDQTGADRVRKVRLPNTFAQWFSNRLQIAIHGGAALASVSSFFIHAQQVASVLYEHRNQSHGLALLHRRALG